MITPKAIYPKGTTFGARIEENKSQKNTVAEYVVTKFLGPGQNVFISDGSSTFFIGLSLFEKKVEGFKLYTNSLPIAHEFPLWETDDWPKEFTLELAGGKVNTKLMMTGGSLCEGIVEQMTTRVQYTVLSVRSIFGIQGPAGREPDSLGIKQAALKNPKRVVLIADHSKFIEEYSTNVPLVYTEADEWTELMRRSTTYVVTTLPPGKTANEVADLGRTLQQNPYQKPKNPEEWYAKNTWPLRSELGKRFIELEHNSSTSTQA